MLRRPRPQLLRFTRRTSETVQLDYGSSKGIGGVDLVDLNLGIASEELKE